MKTKKIKNTHQTNKKKHQREKKICVLNTCILLYLIRVLLCLLSRDDQDDLVISAHPNVYDCTIFPLTVEVKGDLMLFNKPTDIAC